MILVLNCGSQSIKWKVFDKNFRAVKQGSRKILAENYQTALSSELQAIAMSEIAITMVGHRVVHGGNKFRKTVKITRSVLDSLEKLSHFAPLHNPYNILGIKTCQKIFRKIENFAVFDTEFFSDLPETVFTYALPEKLAKKFGFRRFGFHGISHEYVAKKAAATAQKPFDKLKIITCHLGGGSSIAAIKNGKAIDTSMGFTPMEGLVMMTRSGSIDPGIILKITKEFGFKKTGEVLNKESGLKGICGESSMLKILDRIKKGDRKAKLAFDIFVYSIKKYIGSYHTILGGCDILVFTGAVGSGESITRNAICRNLKILKNTKILAIKTDEELAIATKILNF